MRSTMLALLLWLSLLSCNLSTLLILFSIALVLPDGITKSLHDDIQGNQGHFYPEFWVFNNCPFDDLGNVINLNARYCNPLFYECICVGHTINECFLRPSLANMARNYLVTASEMESSHLYSYHYREEPGIINGVDDLTEEITHVVKTEVTSTDSLYNYYVSSLVSEYFEMIITPLSAQTQLAIFEEEVGGESTTLRHVSPSATDQNSSPGSTSLSRSRTTPEIYVFTITKVITKITRTASAPTADTPRANTPMTHAEISLLPVVAVAGGIFIGVLIALSGLLIILAYKLNSWACGLSRPEKERLRDVAPLHIPPQSTQEQGDISWPASAACEVIGTGDIGSHSSSDAGLPGVRGEAFYVDNGRVVKFTWGPGVTAKPGIGDWVKAIVELCLRHPVIWWPLKQRLTYSEQSIRVSWYCTCGEELFVDLPYDVALKYQMQCVCLALPSDSLPLLPLHYPASEFSTSSTSTEGQKTRTSSSNITQRAPLDKFGSKANKLEIKDAQQAEVIGEVSRDRYLHWCVDVNRYETRLFHIPIPSLNDATVISALRSAYNAAAGFRRWFSLTSCYGVKFVMFERVHRSKELVACGNEDLPCPKTNNDSAYTYLDPRAQFLKTLERSFMHHFHSPYGCGAQDIEDILKRIPKKTNGRLEMKFGAAGYGMYAVPGWAFWKLLLAFVLTQIGPTIFAIRWLCGHPGDLQNAFILSFYLVGVLNLLVMVPDIWSMRK